jgi:hypothetical protein
MKRFVRKASRAAICAFLISSPAWGQPKVTIGPSPNRLIALTAIPQGDVDASLKGIFGGDRLNLQPVSFYVSNQTGQPIIGIVVLTVATDSSGRPRTSRDVRDSYMSPSHTPVLNSGARLLVAPRGVWIPEGQVSTFTDDAGGLMLLQRASTWVRRNGTSEINVTVDSVILGNGEVDGPDTTHFAEEVSNRKKAADSILAAIALDPDSQKAALSQMAKQSVPRGDTLAWWQRVFADDYLNSSGPARDIVVRRLRTLDGPSLFRAAQTSNP